MSLRITLSSTGKSPRWALRFHGELKSVRRIVSRIFLLLFAGVLSVCSTFSEPRPSGTDVVLVSGDLGGLPCSELGLIDIALGTEQLPDDCSCTRPYVNEVGEDDFNAAIAEAAVAKEGNTVWILRSWQTQNFRVHLEDCCFTSAQRTIGLVYRCTRDERVIAEDRADSVQYVRVP